MYILPFLFWNLQNMEHLRSMDQDFVKMTDLSPATFPHTFDYYPLVEPVNPMRSYYDSWNNIFRRPYLPSIDQIVEDDDNFKVVINARQFKPDEISVKVVDRWLIVEAKHEEKRGDHSSISRHFMKSYRLPDRADVDQLKSTMSKEGVLTITAPLKPKEPKHEKEIKIELIDDSAQRGDGEDAANANPNAEKKVEENEIREELTTEGQGEKEKPEK